MIHLKDMGWAAGFLEGEGYFGMNTGSPLITAFQLDQEPLRYLKDIFKLGTLRGPYKTALGKPVYCYKVCGICAVQIMLTIFSLMSLRRKEKIKNIIEKWKMGKRKPYQTRKTKEDI